MGAPHRQRHWVDPNWSGLVPWQKAWQTSVGHQGESTTGGEIPASAMVGMIGSEYLVVSNNPAVDPPLAKWRQSVLKKTEKLAGNANERAMALYKEVRGTFSSGEGGIFHPIRGSRYRKMTGRDKTTDDYLAVRLGDRRPRRVLSRCRG